MMEGKNYLVTGASQGIGKEITKRLLQSGANVLMITRNANKVMDLLDKYPGQAYVYNFDLKNLDKIEDIFLYAKEKKLCFDGMVHAAGISEDCPIKNVTVPMMKDIMGVNYFSLVQIGRFFSMKKYSHNNGSVVVLSSLASLSCEQGMSQYAASKAAVNAYVKVMSKELVRRRIRVNAVAPGYVDTDMTWNMREVIENFDAELMNRQPYGVISTEQIAELVLFLLSEKSSYITGDVIPVSGGSRG